MRVHLRFAEVVRFLVGPADLLRHHPVDPGRFRAAVERADAFADDGVGVGDAGVVADVFDPGRGLVGLHPDARVARVAH